MTISGWATVLCMKACFLKWEKKKEIAESLDISFHNLIQNETKKIIPSEKELKSSSGWLNLELPFVSYFKEILKNF